MFSKISFKGVALTLLFALLCGCACSNETATDVTYTEVSVVEESSESSLVVDNQTKYKKYTMAEYLEMNDDTIGWLKIPNTQTDNVVMLGKDKKVYPNNSESGKHHYLNYSFNHYRSVSGELYIDYRGRVENNYLSQNLTVYGHHMNNGTMLGDIEKYRNKTFWQNNQYFRFDTLWSKHLWRVFAVFVIDINKGEDKEFDFRQPEYASDEVFLKFVSDVKDRSLYTTDVEVMAEDRLINLVTCTYPTGRPSVDDARLVVMARMATAEEVKQYYASDMATAEIIATKR